MDYEDLRSIYSKLFYQIQVTKYFKDLLLENINNRQIKLNKLVKRCFKSRKKKAIIKSEISHLNALVNSYKHYCNKMTILTGDLNDIQRKVKYNKKDTITDEAVINEKILISDPDLDKVTRPLSEEIIDNLQEIENVNEALTICDLINFINKEEYEVSEIYGIHHELFINNQSKNNLEVLMIDLKSKISLINKRNAYRRQTNHNTNELIEDKISVNNIKNIITKLCDHLHFLETENLELKETRIRVIRKYCD